MKRVSQTIFICLAVILMSACAARQTAAPAHQPSASFQPAWEIEIETIEDQALAAVLETPTEFFVEFSEDTYAWERALLYLQQNAGDMEVYRDEGWVLVSTRGARYDNFVYDIEKASRPGGFSYRVRATPREHSHSGNELAQINARNLSRFIRDGILERNLIER